MSTRRTTRSPNPPTAHCLSRTFDSAAQHVQAYGTTETGLEPLWDRSLAHGGHLLLHQSTGTLVAGHHVSPGGRHVRHLRPARPALTALLRRQVSRQWIGRVAREHTVLLDIATGAEHARIDWPSVFQGVLFPAPAPGGGIYVTTFGSPARIDVEPPAR